MNLRGTPWWATYRGRLALMYVSLILLATLVVGAFLYYGLRHVYVDLLAGSLARAAHVVGAEADAADGPAALEEMAAEVGELTGARVTLIAHDGTVLADTVADPTAMTNHADRPEVRTALVGGTGVSVRHSDTVDADMLYIAVGAGGELVARLALDMAVVAEAVGRLRVVTLVPLLLVSGLGLVLALRGAARLTRPLREMSEVAMEMGQGNLAARAPTDGPPEAAALGRSLNRLAANLERHISELEDARRRTETLLSGLPAGVVELDPDYAVVGANPAAERMLGFQLEKVKGTHYSSLIRSYRLSEALGAALERGESHRLEVETGKGADQAFHVSVSPLGDAEGRAAGAVLVFEDLGQTRRDARVRRELVANVSHELKTPVASIRALAETLASGATDDPETAQRFLRHIEHESERLARLVDDLLDLARLEAHEVRLDRRPVDPVALVRRAVERFRPLLEQKGIQLVLDLPDESCPPIRADERYLERAVANLMDNAQKFTPQGGTVAVRVTATARSAVEISVSDTGLGLTQEAAGRVFERFYRADADRSRAAGGTGLGLAITKHIVQAHGGEVAVHSDGPGQGCRFSLTLPVE